MNRSSVEDPCPGLTAFSGVIRGRWLWTGAKLVARGGVLVHHGRVAALLKSSEPDPPGAEVLDLPRALLHPGFLDAHVHLDLSGLGGKIPPGLPFPRWLARVRELRAEAGPEGLRAAARDGLRELAAGGTVRLIDFSYGGHSEEAIRESGLRAAVLREVIGPEPARASEAAAAAREWITGRSPEARLTFGLAPHSPYLATAELIRECRWMSAGRPFSIHAAELPGENQLLREGRGELRTFLDEVGAAGYQAKGVGAIEYLERLEVLSGALLVHVAFPGPGDLERIASRGAAVVFCPRSHGYFARPPHPLPDLLQAGVRVALGTDSAASCGTLSMAAEMREVRRLFPDLAAETIFSLGTGALLAGWGGIPWTGDLRPGAPADLAGAELPESASDPLEAFLQTEAPNVLTIAGGRK